MNQIALESLQVLGGAFWASILGQKDNVPPATLGGLCPIADGQTLFYFGKHSNDDPACQGMDWYLLGYLTILVHIVSWGIRWLVWEPAAWTIVRHTKHPTFDDTTCRKISMNMTECLFFVLSGIFAFRLFANEWWLYQPHTWLDGRDDLLVAADVKFYYILYAARFVSDFISLFFEPGRNAKALIIACIHHAVTLGLIAIAIHGNYMRGGSVIMFFFDWADPPLLLAKTCKYMSHDPADWFQFAANRFFEVFALTFFVSRNIIYGYVSFHFVVTLHKEALFERLFLILLVILQTYWFVLLLKAVTRRSKHGGNVQEDDRDFPKKKHQ